MTLASIMVNIRPGIRRLLTASAVLSLLALWWPPRVGQVSTPVARDDASLALARPSSGVAAALPGMAAPVDLPPQLPQLRWGKAAFDPFVGGPEMAAPAKPASQLAPAPVAYPPAPPAPAAPSTPPVGYRYLGQMVGPAGQRLIYLARGDQSIPVQVGTRLDDGFVVEAMDAAGIKLHYPPSGSHALIPMPAPPDNNTR